MYNNNVVLNDKSRKIKSHSSKSHRANPYTKNRNVHLEKKSDVEQGILGRVSNYIVPNWISSWWKKDKNEESSGFSENDESDESDENNAQSSQPQIIKSNENHKIKSLSYEGTQNSNSIVQSTAVKPPLLGFYDKVGNSDNTLNQPSFLDNSFDSVQIYPSKQSFSNDEKVIEVSNSNTVNHKSSFVPKPAFNVSAFISPNLSTQNFNTTMNTTLDLSAVNKSLFYSGQTKFGGSSTYRQDSIKRQRISPVSNQACTTLTQMKAKSLPYAKRNAVTSATAKKILSTLDNMSSPVKDSRKLPSMQHLISPLTFSQKLRDLSKKKDSNIIKPPVSTLDTVKPSQKGFILSTNNTNTDQQQFVKPLKSIESFTFAKSDLSASEKVPVDSKQSSDIITTKTDNFLSKKTGKLRREHTSNHYSVPKTEEIINTLPSIPNVSFSLPSITTFKSSFQSASVEILPKPFISIESKEIAVKDAFYFSEPSVLAVRNHSEDPKMQCYTFSEPISIKKQSENKVSPPIFINNEKDRVKEGIIFKTFKLPGSWECSVCLVNNKPDFVKCAACQNEKTKLPIENNNIKAPSVSSSFLQIPQIKHLSSKFLKSENSWDCSTCLINNKYSSDKCVACETPKSKSVANEHFAADNSKVTIINENFKAPTVFNNNPQISQTNPLSLKFLKSESSWDCSTCLINNKSSSEKCVACETPNPKSIASVDKFKSDNQNTKTNLSLSNSLPSSSIFTFGKPNHSDSQINIKVPSFLSTTSKADFANVSEDAALSSNVFPLAKPLSESNIFTFGKPSNLTAQNDSKTSFFKTGTNDDNIVKVSECTSFSSNFFTHAKSLPESSIFTFGKPNYSTVSNDVPALLSTTNTAGTFIKDSENTNFSGNVPLLAKSLPGSSIFSFGKPIISTQNSNLDPSLSMTSSKTDSFAKVSESANISSNVITFAKSLPETSIFTFGKPNNSFSQNSFPPFLSTTTTNSNATLNSVPTLTFNAANNESKSRESSQSTTTPLFSFGKINEKNCDFLSMG